MTLVDPHSFGLIFACRSLRFSKRFFWFSDEAFNPDSLDSYVRAEKADVAHHNAAWAHETGKGLLFFAKRTEDKAAPAGILNLVRSSTSRNLHAASLTVMSRLTPQM
jgi:Pleckstrin homology domain